MPDILTVDMDSKDIQTVADIRKVKRIIKTPAELDKMVNKSQCKLTDYNLPHGSYYGKNFMFCDLERLDLRDCVLVHSNFSFAVNFDKVITNSVTRIIECNLGGVQGLPPSGNVKTKKITRENTETINWNTAEIKRLEKEQPEGWKEEVDKLKTENTALQAEITAAQNAMIQDCNMKIFTDAEVKAWSDSIKMGVIDG